jgi:endonuclease G
LESYILDNARSKGFKACVFTGPVLGNEDIEVKPGVFAPIEFWKVVAMVDSESSELHATAYLLSQGDLIRRLIEQRSRVEALEGYVLGEYRTFQIAIRDLAAATGYDFSAYEAADPLARTKPGAEAIHSNEPLFLPLEALADVVM